MGRGVSFFFSVFPCAIGKCFRRGVYLFRRYVFSSELPSLKIVLCFVLWELCVAWRVDRVMDEFDVFMDAMSRNIAMKQVINFAKNSSQRQFILITPQVSTSQPNLTYIPRMKIAGLVSAHQGLLKRNIPGLM